MDTCDARWGPWTCLLEVGHDGCHQALCGTRGNQLPAAIWFDDGPWAQPHELPQSWYHDRDVRLGIEP